MEMRGPGRSWGSKMEVGVPELGVLDGDRGPGWKWGSQMEVGVSDRGRGSG